MPTTKDDRDAAVARRSAGEPVCAGADVALDRQSKCTLFPDVDELVERLVDDSDGIADGSAPLRR